MFAHVERKHWWIQFPFSWGVEGALVLTLLVGIGFAAVQVRGRDATIADQAAVIGQQAASLRQSGEPMGPLGRVAELNGAIIEAYGQLPVQSTAMELARRAGSGEVYDIVTVEAAQRTQRRIEMLLAQPQEILSALAGYEARPR